MVFKDRVDAGKQLAKMLINYKDPKTIVLGIPRGGVVVAAEVAKELKTPLNILVVKKIGLPYQPEIGIGAVAENEVLVWNKEFKLSDSLYNIYEHQLKELADLAKEELYRRASIYRKYKDIPKITNQKVILVDDGLATGVTALAAIKSVKQLKPETLVYATPVADKDEAQKISKEVNDLVVAIFIEELESVGLEYENFNQTTDQEVVDILISN
jgi:predicted phosphoribosyltransferase